MLIRILAVLLAANLILAALLLLWPYFVNRPAGEAEYHITHTTGLDPAGHWPFSKQGLGLALFSMAFPFSCLTGPIALVLLVMQGALLMQNWYDIPPWERNIHVAFVASAIGLVLILLLFGVPITEYLLD